jgi:molybdopterin-containing oxidoreductase family membrane subunit
MEQVEGFRSRLEGTVFAPLVRTGDWYYRLVALLCLIIGWGIYAYITQFQQGLIETGMRDRISWGLYIALFVFVIAISYGGTLISAILRITHAGWRTPITRMAEFITVAALLTGVLLVIIDLGRPDNVHHLLLFPRWQSPIAWDVIAISTYLVGSIFYLYLPLIPDLARFRDRLGNETPQWKRRLLSLASLGWKGLPGQKRYLGIAMTTMMLLIVPLAIMVHTVLSWIFGMTLREPWDAAIFGIYFVSGAVFSGVAAVIIIMAILRKIYHLEEYITRKHFVYLGYILAALATVMIYFNILEYVTTGYKLAGEAGFHLRQLFTGALAPFYWVYAMAGLVAPALIVIGVTRFAPRHTVAGVVIASFLVTIGMWIERYIIVVGGLRVPLMPYEPASYAPTWVEWSIMAGILALFALVLTVFVKLFPVMAIWEVEEHHEKEAMRS